VNWAPNKWKQPQSCYSKEKSYKHVFRQGAEYMIAKWIVAIAVVLGIAALPVADLHANGPLILTSMGHHSHPWATVRNEAGHLTVDI
jgi:hypothetical protein